MATFLPIFIHNLHVYTIWQNNNDDDNDIMREPILEIGDFPTTQSVNIARNLREIWQIVTNDS